MFILTVLVMFPMTPPIDKLHFSLLDQELCWVEQTAALCCFGLPCAVWCPSVLCGAAVSGVAPRVLLCRAAVFCAVRLGLVSCCAPCSACCVCVYA